MIDLEKEREAFESVFGKIPNGIKFDANLKAYVAASQSIDRMSWDSMAILNGYWEFWLKCAELKQSEIDELKAKLEAAQVPEGFILVPKEPTEEIINAMHDSFLGAFIEGKATGGQSIEFAYKAMIEAAQGEEE